jgi:hypothetical protein
MRIRLRKSNPLSIALLVLGLLVGTMVYSPLLSKAHTSTSAITIVNNSSHEVRHVFLSAPDQNNWSADQLNSSTIPANGGSATISNISCNGSSIKVIAEDEDGCFVYQVVSCADSVTWTITNAATRDCGN